ncbi:RNA polymerase subunit sigma-70 [Flindersiella endophytica]
MQVETPGPLGSERSDFDQRVGAYRRELLLHCYRMVGSLSDAEDVLQETLLAAWQGLPGFEGRSSLRAWLYRIATNRCLNLLRDNRRRIPAEPLPPFEPPEPTRRADLPWLRPFPDALLPEDRYTALESVELAFVAALQRIPPRQVAVVVLCDVLGYSLAEAASMLDATSTAVKGLLQRARSALRQSATATHRSPGTVREQEVVRRFAEAFTKDDIDGVLDLLTDDAWLAMPPAPHEYVGAEAIAAFLRASTAWRVGENLRIELRPTRVNGQPAFDCLHVGAEEYPAGTIVLTLAGARVRGITRFLPVG